jgi:hypothetical protein
LRNDVVTGGGSKDVRFGSTAVVHHPISSTSAFGGKAEVKNAGNHEFVGPESAASVSSIDLTRYFSD